MPRVLRQNWKNSGNDWAPRPVGYSLHLTEKDREMYLETYWRNLLPNPPSRYLYPFGTSFWYDVDENTLLLLEVKSSRNGIYLNEVPEMEKTNAGVS